jgi:hypothetical protein
MDMRVPSGNAAFTLLTSSMVDANSSHRGENDRGTAAMSALISCFFTGVYAFLVLIKLLSVGV